MIEHIKSQDPEVYEAMKAELDRQRNSIELIASENIVSPAVMEAAGSVLTNKYAEGLPDKRYYGGCEFVDVVEKLAIERACKLFNAKHANVQPHSGAQANFAAYHSLCKVGDTVLGMDLSNGGHLTHGSKVNFSGKLYNIVSYGLDPETELIDYDDVYKKAKEHKPAMILAGASAYSRIIDFVKFAEIADEVGAKFMVDMAHISGLVAAGYHPNPVDYADVVTLTTHKTLRATRGGMILCNDDDLFKKVNSAVFPYAQGGPLMHIIAAKAVAFKEALQPEFKDYIKQVLDNTKALAEGMESKGLRLVSGGTDNHLVLVDLRDAQVTGKKAEKVLGELGITVNKNAIPNDPEKPMVTSGIRVGGAAITSRGFTKDESLKIGEMIGDCVYNIEDEAMLDSIRYEVRDLCGAHPLYQEFDY